MHRHRLDGDPAPVERGENRRHRASAVRDPAAQQPPVRAHLAHLVERPQDCGRAVDRSVRQLDDDGLALHARFQLLGRPLDDDAPPADDRKPVRQRVGLLEVVRRKQDRQQLLARKHC